VRTLAAGGPRCCDDVSALCRSSWNRSPRYFVRREQMASGDYAIEALTASIDECQFPALVSTDCQTAMVQLHSRMCITIFTPRRQQWAARSIKFCCRPSVRCPLTPISRDAISLYTCWTNFNDTLQKYLPSEWALLKRFSRLEVRHQENSEMKGIMHFIYLFVFLIVSGNDCVIAKMMATLMTIHVVLELPSSAGFRAKYQGT